MEASEAVRAAIARPSAFDRGQVLGHHPAQEPVPAVGSADGHGGDQLRFELPAVADVEVLRRVPKVATGMSAAREWAATEPVW